PSSPARANGNATPKARSRRRTIRPLCAGARGGNMVSPVLLHAVAQALGLGQRLELLERVVLDLADALARDAECLADLLERAGLHPVEPEAELDHAPLALRQRCERVLDVGPAEGQRRRVERRLGLLVLDEVTELGVLLLADRALERDRVLRHAQDLAHL